MASYTWDRRTAGCTRSASRRAVSAFTGMLDARWRPLQMAGSGLTGPAPYGPRSWFDGSGRRPTADLQRVGSAHRLPSGLGGVKAEEGVINRPAPGMRVHLLGVLSSCALITVAVIG